MTSIRLDVLNGRYLAKKAGKERECQRVVFSNEGYTKARAEREANESFGAWHWDGHPKTYLGMPFRIDPAQQEDVRFEA